ncbi:SMI1/KNR4 family protein [Streptomyces sp. NPDC059851]|uniref:SMI1/KNR4 family protein n=1 Tax=Streptomyces sp. NPDC059851 TaxID=3346971 RepID=UPI0036535994
MIDRRPPLSSLYEFGTWDPVLRLLLAGYPEIRPDGSARVAGRISRTGWSLWLRGGTSSEGPAAVEHVQRALARGGVEEVAFSAEIRPTGRTTLRLVWPCPAVEAAIGYPDLGVLVLVEGSVPEPWRRLPDPVPGAVPAPSADLELLERTLRERIPDAIGATEEEIAAAEARLGVILPDELKVFYRVTRVRGEAGEDREDDHEAWESASAAVGYEVSALHELYAIDPAVRHSRWELGATKGVATPPDAPVQGLAGSPGWIVFGSNGGDEIAVDLTPGPGGHLGQVILVDHEQSLGAELVADSFTDLVLGRQRERPRARRADLPAVAEVGGGDLPTVRAAARPALEVLSVRAGDGAPFSLSPVTGLPRLRTLTAAPGTLADPLEIAELTGLEFLELGLQEWRVLLDAGAVPRSLSAAAIRERERDRGGDRGAVVAVANELLALWDRPRIDETVLEGDLLAGA